MSQYQHTVVRPAVEKLSQAALWRAVVCRRRVRHGAPTELHGLDAGSCWGACVKEGLDTASRPESKHHPTTTAPACVDNRRPTGGNPMNDPGSALRRFVANAVVARLRPGSAITYPTLSSATSRLIRATHRSRPAASARTQVVCKGSGPVSRRSGGVTCSTYGSAYAVHQFIPTHLSEHREANHQVDLFWRRRDVARRIGGRRSSVGIGLRCGIRGRTHHSANGYAAATPPQFGPEL